MYPTDRKYTREHEWVLDDGSVCTVGITAFAAEQLGDVTFVELPQTGKDVKAGDAISAVESVKAASDVYTPVGGTVSETNAAIEAQPELVNESPHDQGWFFKVKGYDASALDALMDAAAYEAYIKELEE
jgi:glycine cleavage system H protein